MKLFYIIYKMDNKLSDILAEEIRKRKNEKNDAHKRILAMLTPETVKRELLNALHKLENITDPRIYNSPLPNDSTPTRQFGALAYVFDGYPGFVWRKGSWYKITPRLHFSQLPLDEEQRLLFKPVLKGKLFTDDIPDPTMTLDDAYYPVKIDGIRVFLREYWVKSQQLMTCYTKNGYADKRLVETNKLTETVLYSPELQACIKCNRSRAELMNYPNIVFEDPEYTTRLNLL